MFNDLCFQSTWQYIEYVVPSSRLDENPVPNITLYHNTKVCKRGTVSYFVGYDVNNKYHIVNPAFIENCISTNKKLLFLPKFLKTLEINPNNKHKLFYQTQKLSKNKKGID